MNNIIAPCPKKPTAVLQPSLNRQDEVDDACTELRQILQQSRHYGNLLLDDDQDGLLIPRTNNPLPLDSSFVPVRLPTYRPRSLSVGDSRPLINLVH
ncbi:hypothetical protein BC941DRAFT_421840 [Chlamydoabsidia padenii]|nr:hypothetical protein BC941DRAFT_421840 [Chlamydoabsidia padenii]